jgi:hypothetical protein
MARPERFELPTLWFEARCSIQLSYGRVITFYPNSTFLFDQALQLFAPFARFQVSFAPDPFPLYIR